MSYPPRKTDTTANNQNSFKIMEPLLVNSLITLSVNNPPNQYGQEQYHQGAPQAQTFGSGHSHQRVEEPPYNSYPEQQTSPSH